MKIEYVGPGSPGTVQASGGSYAFRRDANGRQVANVDPRHAAPFLARSDLYRRVRDESAPSQAAESRSGPVAAETIEQAVAMLDPAMDSHWTRDGKPQVDDVSALLGRRVTRAEIDEALPEFQRPEA